MGDDAHHATSAVDYQDIRQMRMAATVYVAHIGEDKEDLTVGGELVEIDL